jgi:methanogenic corrinoid protein MtbC1
MEDSFSIENFVGILKNKKKDEAILYCIEYLKSFPNINPLNVYEKFILPFLSNYQCFYEEEFCVWEEHFISSTFNSIIGSVYPYLISYRKVLLDKNEVTLKNKTILFACPSEEYHELGIKIVSDYFYMEGFNVYYLGANTPQEEIFRGAKILNVDFIALSVSNPYNILTLKRTIKYLKRNINEMNLNMKIIVGGGAFKNNKTLVDEVDADFFVEDISNINRFSDRMFKEG